MFGHQDQTDGQQDTNQPEPQADATLSSDAAMPAATNTPAPTGAPTTDEAAVDNGAGDYIMTDPQTPAPHTKSIADDGQDRHDTQDDQGDMGMSNVSNDDLLSLKQGALQQLTPLLGHLDQTPEEKFRTTMMMIQASDNQALLKTAYEAAQQISDEKARAQALLDVVNEINYFTQQSADDNASSDSNGSPEE